MRGGPTLTASELQVWNGGDETQQEMTSWFAGVGSQKCLVSAGVGSY